MSAPSTTRELWRGVVSRGDLLHIPRGFIHQATTSEEPAAHFTLQPTGSFAKVLHVLEPLAKGLSSEHEAAEHALQGMTQALREMVNHPDASWLREHMPPSYLEERMRPTVLQKLSTGLHRSLNTYLKGAAQSEAAANGIKAALAPLFAADSEALGMSLADVMSDARRSWTRLESIAKQTASDPERVQRVCREGRSHIVHPATLFRLAKGRTGASYYRCGGENAKLCIKTESGTSFLRWTRVLQEAAAFVFGLGPSERALVKDIPGNDDLEKIATVQWCRRMGIIVVQQGTGEKNSLAMLNELTSAPRAKAVGARKAPQEL